MYFNFLYKPLSWGLPTDYSDGIFNGYTRMSILSAKIEYIFLHTHKKKRQSQILIQEAGKIHSSPKENYIFFIDFSWWPKVRVSDPGSRSSVRVSDPGATRKMERLNVTFFGEECKKAKDKVNYSKVKTPTQEIWYFLRWFFIKNHLN